LENQRGKQNGRISEFKTLVDSVSTLDAVVLDAASSIGSALDQFFASAGALSRDNESVSFKAQFFASATQLSERFSGVNDTINALRDGSVYGAKEAVQNVNRLASQLTEINQKIVETVQTGSLAPAPDLLDRRDQLLMSLQQELGGQVVISPDGLANFFVNGNPIVGLNGAATLSFQNDSVYLSLSSNPNAIGSRFAIEGNASGRVKAYISLLNDFVPDIEFRIGEIAKSVADTVNAKLTSAGMQPEPGGEMFAYDVDADTGAISNFRLRDDLDTSASVILASEAKAIEGIRLDPDSPVTQWASVTTFVGGEVASWRADLDAASIVAQRLDQDRERISGVNLDEEAANLIRFQQLYGAAAKVLQMGSQLFDQLLSILR
ncbi:MAG: hypothetical protein RIR70_2231, partial [Pseudomonadota bacterium]